MTMMSPYRATGLFRGRCARVLRYGGRAVAVLSLGVLLTACGHRESAEERTLRERGEALFAAQRCIHCHGPGGAGTVTAPPLTDARRNFDTTRLVSYLRDPGTAIKNDSRLLARQSRYGALMPSFRQLDAKDLHAIAAYVLSL
jgi:mono/diheme cytochrome c family protein